LVTVSNRLREALDEVIDIPIIFDIDV